MVNGTINDGVRDSPSVSAARTLVLTVKTDPIITAINRYRAARAELDKIAFREPMPPNGNPADETEEYAAWETAGHKAQDVAATAWAEVKFASPTHAFRLSWARLPRLPTEPRA
jgi:hypothetical protein